MQKQCRILFLGVCIFVWRGINNNLLARRTNFAYLLCCLRFPNRGHALDAQGTFHKNTNIASRAYFTRVWAHSNVNNIHNRFEPFIYFLHLTFKWAFSFKNMPVFLFNIIIVVHFRSAIFFEFLWISMLFMCIVNLWICMSWPNWFYLLQKHAINIIAKVVINSDTTAISK